MFSESNMFHFFKGRIALYAIMSAMDVKPGDEVILPGFTCVVVPNAITYLGARPVYVDIDPATFNIDYSKIEEKITDRTKVIIAQHTFGIPVKMDKIMDIAKKYNSYVIEDSCHAIKSKYQGKEIGTFGDAAFFSSQWSKPVTTGLGGWAVVNNPEIKRNMEKSYPEYAIPSNKEIALLKFQYHAYSKLLKPSFFWFAQNTYRKLSKYGVTIGSSYNEELECKMPEEYKIRMSKWQKKLLYRKFIEIEKNTEHRQWITDIYENIIGQNGIAKGKFSRQNETTLLRYPLLCRDKERVMKEAKKNRIEIGDWFVSPIHPNLTHWEKAYYRKGSCSVAEKVCKHIINLPTHSKIGENEAEKILKVISSSTELMPYFSI